MRKPGKRAKPAASTGEWKPRVFFWVLTVALVILSAAELFNALRRPSLLRIAGLPGAKSLIVYQKGRPESRAAWLFYEPGGEESAPVCFQRIDCTTADEDTGEIRWSFTGDILYATRRRADTIDTGSLPLWAYDLTTGALYAVSDEAAKFGLPVKVTGEREIVELINSGGGKGPLALAWYDFGKRGEYLPAWKSTRWEQQLPR